MDDARVAACARAFTLTLPKRMTGRSHGETLGSNVGSSLEFQDYRPYQPGDDLRHVDWAAFARSDDLLVRLHREEFAPTVEVIVDTSVSMASTDAKQERTRELVALIVSLAQQDRFTPFLITLGDQIRTTERHLDQEVRRLSFGGRGGLPRILHSAPRLRRGALRVVVSDLLFPDLPGPLVGRLGRDASSLKVIQVLDEQEWSPTFAGGTRLVDVESDETLDVMVSEVSRSHYITRLHRLITAWSDEVRRARGALATVVAQTPLDEAARDPLRRAGIVSVRGMEASRG